MTLVHRAPWLMLPILALVAACKATPSDDTADTDTDTDEPEMQPLFSFAVFADPHIVSNPDNQARLEAAVQWVADHREEHDLELVLIVGDVAWGPGLPTAYSVLDELPVPWVPLIGDNEVIGGSEQPFQDTFAPQFSDLETELDGWSKAAMPVWDPVYEQDAWLQNASFDLHGVHFATLDWCVRGETGVLGEFGNLHDHEGGTLPWLESDIAASTPTARNSLVLASHIPMHLGLFDLAEMERLGQALGPHADALWANYAGHIHTDAEHDVQDIGYDVFVVDATWDDENSFLLVHVSGNGLGFEYTHEKVVVE